MHRLMILILTLEAVSQEGTELKGPAKAFVQWQCLQNIQSFLEVTVR